MYIGSLESSNTHVLSPIVSHSHYNNDYHTIDTSCSSSK